MLRRAVRAGRCEPGRAEGMRETRPIVFARPRSVPEKFRGPARDFMNGDVTRPPVPAAARTRDAAMFPGGLPQSKNILRIFFDLYFFFFSAAHRMEIKIIFDWKYQTRGLCTNRTLNFNALKISTKKQMHL